MWFKRATKYGLGKYHTKTAVDQERIKSFLLANLQNGKVARNLSQLLSSMLRAVANGIEGCVRT